MFSLSLSVFLLFSFSLYCVSLCCITYAYMYSMYTNIYIYIYMYIHMCICIHTSAMHVVPETIRTGLVAITFIRKTRYSPRKWPPSPSSRCSNRRPRRTCLRSLDVSSRYLQDQMNQTTWHHIALSCSNPNMVYRTVNPFQGSLVLAKAQSQTG